MTRKKATSEEGPGAPSLNTAPAGDRREPSPAPAPNGDLVVAVAPPPGDQQYPIVDVLRNNGTDLFACRLTGLLLPPGAARQVTVRDGAHLAQLLEVIAQFNDGGPQPGELQFDRLHR
jgi:hypothetical protein